MPRAKRIPDWPAVQQRAAPLTVALRPQYSSTAVLVRDIQIPALESLMQYRRREGKLHPRGEAKTPGQWLREYEHHVATSRPYTDFGPNSAPWNTHFAIQADAKRGPAAFVQELFRLNEAVFREYQIIDSPEGIGRTLMSKTTRPEDVRSYMSTLIDDLHVDANIRELLIPSQVVKCSDGEISAFLDDTHAWYARIRPSLRNEPKYTAPKHL